MEIKAQIPKTIALIAFVKFILRTTAEAAFAESKNPGWLAGYVTGLAFGWEHPDHPKDDKDTSDLGVEFGYSGAEIQSFVAGFTIGEDNATRLHNGLKKSDDTELSN